MRVSVSALAVALCAVAACGGSTRGVNGAGGGACPTGDVVRYAIRESADSGGQAYGAPAVDHWRIPVGFRFEDEDPPPPGPISREAVRLLGMPGVPDAVWIYDGANPGCRARISGFVATPDDQGVGVSTTISAVTTDCPAVGDARDAWVLAVADEPVGCVYMPAGALDSQPGDETDDGYAIPQNRKPVPAPFDRVVARPACAPSCATLWSLRSVETIPRVAELTVTHITSDGSPDDACSWEAQDQFGVYVGGGLGQAPVELTLPPSDRADDVAQMSLAGAFVDGGGPRVVTLLDIAVWGAYSLTPEGGYGNGRRIRYYRNHEEDFWYRSLAPYCGP